MHPSQTNVVHLIFHKATAKLFDADVSTSESNTQQCFLSELIHILSKYIKSLAPKCFCLGTNGSQVIFSVKPSSIYLYTKQTGEKVSLFHTQNELLHAIFSWPHTPGHRPVCTVRTIDIFVPSSSISQVPSPFLFRTDLAFGNLFVRCSCRFSLGSFIVLAIAMLLLSICLEWTGMSQKTRNILWDSCEISRRSYFSHQIKLLRISTMKYLPHSFCIVLS